VHCDRNDAANAAAKFLSQMHVMRAHKHLNLKIIIDLSVDVIISEIS
jgi:hypothetical protein